MCEDQLAISGSQSPTFSEATARTSTSKSRPCTGGRAKCQVKPPGLAPRRTISLGQERMDVEDRIDLGRGHVRPAEAERRHPLLHRPEHETCFLAHRLRRLVTAPNVAPFIAGAAIARFAASGGDEAARRAVSVRHCVAEGVKRRSNPAAQSRGSGSWCLGAGKIHRERHRLAFSLKARVPSEGEAANADSSNATSMAGTTGVQAAEVRRNFDSSQAHHRRGHGLALFERGHAELKA